MGTPLWLNAKNIQKSAHAPLFGRLVRCFAHAWVFFHETMVYMLVFNPYVMQMSVSSSVLASQSLVKLQCMNFLLMYRCHSLC